MTQYIAVHRIERRVAGKAVATNPGEDLNVTGDEETQLLVAGAIRLPDEAAVEKAATEEAERLATEEAEKAEAERLATEEAEKAEAEQAEAEKAEAEKAEKAKKPGRPKKGEGEELL